jgi:hypothetical protein
MADGGPKASASVGADILASATNNPTQALKEVNRQIKATEAEMAALAKKGKIISQEMATRIQELRAGQNTLKTQAQGINNLRSAAQAGKIAKKVIFAQSLNSILQGDFQMEDVATYAFLAERQIRKAAKKFLGLKFAESVSAGLLYLPLVAYAVRFGLKGWENAQKLKAGRDEVHAAFARNEIPFAVRNLADYTLTDTNRDPKKMVASTMKLANSMAAMTDSGVRSVLGNAFDVSMARSPLTNRISGDLQILNRAEIIKRLQERRQSMIESKGGGLLTDAENKYAFQWVLADYVKEHDLPDDFLNKIIDKMEKQGGASKALAPTPKEKFNSELGRERDAYLARSRFIPAKMEY